MSAIMKVLGLADGTEFSKEMWVESFNVDTEPDPTQMSSFTHEGVGILNGAFGGRIYITPYEVRAQRFKNAAEAMLAWNLQSTLRPLRPDGRPNKPLTVLTVEIQATA